MTNATGRNDASKVIAMLIKNRNFSEADISKYLEAHGYLQDKQVLLQIMVNMAKREGGIFAMFIRDKILDIADSSLPYVELIRELSMSEGYFALDHLISLFERNASTAQFVYEELDKLSDARLSVPMGLLLAGRYKNRSNELLEIIDRTKVKEDAHHNIAYMLALQTVFRNSKLPNKYAGFIIRNSMSTDWDVRHTAIRSMFLLFDSNLRFGTALKKLAKLHDKAEFTISLNALILAKDHKKFTLELLSVCTKSNDANVLSNVSISLASIAPDYPVECLRFVRKWMQRGFRHKIDLRWLLEQIGKGDAQKTADFLLEWIGNERDQIILKFDLPNFLTDIYANNLGLMLQLLKRIDINSSRNRNFVIDTLEKTLSEFFNSIARSDPFAKQSYAMLIGIAKALSVDVNQVTIGINDPVMKSLAIIDACKYPVKAPNSKRIRDGLKQFPMLTNMLGRKWFDDEIKRVRRPHTLLILLAKASVSPKKVNQLTQQLTNETNKLGKAFLAEAILNEFYPFALLSHISSALGAFKPDEQGMPNLIRRLKNEDEFFQTLSELEIAACLRKKFPVTLQYKVGNNPVDIKVTIDGKDFLVEVLDLDRSMKLKFVRSIISMNNRAKDKVLEKLNEQIAKYAEKTASPIILAINNSKAGTDQKEVMDSLEGSMVVHFVSKNKGEEIATYVTRAKDSISDKSEWGKHISGIIVVKRDFDSKDMKIKLFGDIFENRMAIRHLDEQTVQTIKDTVLGLPL